MDGCRVQHLGPGWHQIPLERALMRVSRGQGAHEDTLSPSMAQNSLSLPGPASLLSIKGRLLSPVCSAEPSVLRQPRRAPLPVLGHRLLSAPSKAISTSSSNYQLEIKQKSKNSSDPSSLSTPRQVSQ